MTDSINILRISTDTYPEVLGGGALHAHEMSKLQSDMGHEVTLLTSDHGNDTAPRIECRSGYTLRRYSEIARPFGNSITPKMVPCIWRRMKEADVVHAHSHLYLSTNLTALIRKFNDTPLVLTNHGLYSQSAPKAIQDIFLNTVGKLTFNSADRVLCYTDVDRNRLHNRSVNTPISVIHNGIDCEVFTPDAGEKQFQRILFVGRLKESKGPIRLLRAFANIAGDFPDLTLLFVGEGPLEKKMRKLIRKLELKGRVELRGSVQNKKLPEIYAESTVLALPSMAEGLPRTVLESLACKTPVVTTDLPQLEDLVDGVGLTVSQQSSGELKTALSELLSNPDCQKKMGDRGRQRVINNYSWSETVEQTTQIYNELISDN